MRPRVSRKAVWLALAGLFFQLVLAGPIAASALASLLAVPSLAGAICHSDPGERGDVPADQPGTPPQHEGCLLCPYAAGAAALAAPPPQPVLPSQTGAARAIPPADRGAHPIGRTAYLSRAPPAAS
jgi:hypothetical protein